MNIKCPRCDSTEFKKLSLIYAEGLSDLEARSRGWGLLVGSGGAELGFGKFRTKGEIQTRLSKSSSPPRKWSYWKIVFWGLIGLLVLEFIFGYVDAFLRINGNFNQQLAWFGYTWLGVVTIVLFGTFRHNVLTVRKRCRLWDRAFMCRCCGHILQIVPPQTDSLPPRGVRARPFRILRGTQIDPIVQAPLAQSDDSENSWSIRATREVTHD